MQQRVQQWKESGKKRGFISGRAIFAARCWWYNNGLYNKDHELYDPELEEYIRASTAFAVNALNPPSRFPFFRFRRNESQSNDSDNWGQLLRGRENCATCGTSYSLENLGICTDCLQYVCCGNSYGNRWRSGVSCAQQHANCDGTIVG